MSNSAQRPKKKAPRNVEIGDRAQSQETSQLSQMQSASDGEEYPIAPGPDVPMYPPADRLRRGSISRTIASALLPGRGRASKKLQKSPQQSSPKGKPRAGQAAPKRLGPPGVDEAGQGIHPREECARAMVSRDFLSRVVHSDFEPDPTMRMDFESNSPLVIGRTQSMPEMGVLLRLLLVRLSLINLMHSTDALDELMTAGFLSPQEKTKLSDSVVIMLNLLTRLIESNRIEAAKQRLSDGDTRQFLQKLVNEANEVLGQTGREWNAWNTKQPSQAQSKGS